MELHLIFAFAANAFNNKIHFGRAKVIGQCDLWNFTIGQAKSFFTAYTIKMNMQVMMLLGITVMGA